MSVRQGAQPPPRMYGSEPLRELLLGAAAVGRSVPGNRCQRSPTRDFGRQSSAWGSDAAFSFEPGRVGMCYEWRGTATHWPPHATPKLLPPFLSGFGGFFIAVPSGEAPDFVSSILQPHLEHSRSLRLA
jgi:hypothetical protein